MTARLGAYARRRSLPNFESGQSLRRNGLSQESNQIWPHSSKEVESWPEVFERWRRVEKLQAALVKNHSESADVWRQLSEQRERLSEDRDRMDRAVQTITNSKLYDQNSTDQLVVAKDRLWANTQLADGLQQRLESLLSAKAQLDSDIGMEQSLLFYQIEHLLGPQSTVLPHKKSKNKERREISRDKIDDVARPLAQYYDTVGWLSVLRERLQELRYDHIESQEARRPWFRMSRSPSRNGTESDLRFEQAEADLLQQLVQAQKQAEQWQQECIEQNIEITHRPLSSTGYSDDPSSPENQRYRSRTESIAPEEIVPLRPAPPSQSRRHHPSPSAIRSAKVPFVEASSFIKSWVDKLWPRPHTPKPPLLGLHDQTRKESKDSILMTSTRSLPEYVIVGPTIEWQYSTESEHPEEREMREKQARIGMSMRRKFAYTRPAHSDSSLLSDSGEEISSALRRATVHEISRSLLTSAPPLLPRERISSR